MTDIDKTLKNYLAKTATARELYTRHAESEAQKVPSAALIQAKDLMNPSRRFACPHCGKAITPFKKPLSTQRIWNAVWLAGFALCFLLSFVFSRFFLQFLAAAVLLGVKWIVDQKVTRTQILIYKALKESEEKIHSRDVAQFG